MPLDETEKNWERTRKRGDGERLLKDNEGSEGWNNCELANYNLIMNTE